MTLLDREVLLRAAGAALDPVFEKPLSELGAIADFAVDASSVTMRVRVSTPSSELHRKLEERLRATLESHGATSVAIAWDVQVPTREVTSEDPVPGVKNVILVMSGKGGVGKSTTAVNLALALKRLGTRVGLLDADIYGPSIPTMMGVRGSPASEDGVHIEPLERFGVKLMSIGFLLEDDRQAIVWRGPMLHGALQQFLKDVRWGTLDYLVLDLPPGTGDVALTLSQRVKVTGAVIVTTPQEVALQDVYKSVSMCQKLNLPVLGVVENMSYFVDPAGLRHELFGRGGGEKVADFAKAPLLGQVPIDTAVREWGDGGMPVVQAKPDSAAALAFADIAEKLATRIALEHFERGGGAAPKTSNAPRLKIVR